MAEIIDSNMQDIVSEPSEISLRILQIKDSPHDKAVGPSRVDKATSGEKPKFTVQKVRSKHRNKNSALAKSQTLAQFLQKNPLKRSREKSDTSVVEVSISF